MRTSFLSFSPPSISDEEVNEVVDTLRSDWITTGPKTKRFEEEFSRYLGLPQALAVNSCTAALHLSLVALGLKPGDEVITTPMTFCSSVNVIEHVGATPVLADIEPDTLNVSPAKVEAAITPRTRCILLVHYAGHPCEMDEFSSMAASHGIPIVEDAAHALPALYRGKAIGTFGNLTAFSFYATKNMTTAEGGMLTGDLETLENARLLSLHGMSRDAWMRYSQGGSWFYQVVAPGFKYNMTDIQASIGLQQLRKLAAFQAKRRSVVEKYNEVFSRYDYFQTPIERPGMTSSWYLYVLRLNLDTLTIDRDRYIQELTARNIGTSVHFIPIHLHPFYRDKYRYSADDYPVAYGNYLRLVSLPLHPGLTDEDVNDVIEAVLEVAKAYRR
jgi:dTDP-4-amino-4,6-dideoxygalactose transaminase